MKQVLACAAVYLGVLTACTTAMASPAPPGPDKPKVYGVVIASSLGGEESFYLAVRLTIADGWVLYGPVPNEKGGPVPVEPATVTVTGDGVEAGPALWPADRRHDSDVGSGVQTNWGYEKTATIHVPIKVVTRASGPPPGAVTITVKVTGQVCSESSCALADTGPMQVKVQSITGQKVSNPAWTRELAAGLMAAVPAEKLPALRVKAPAASQAAPPPSSSLLGLPIWAGLGLALLAGLILNIMPCVLPVIPLHVLSLVQLAGQNRRHLVTLGLAFGAGVILFFVALAAANVVFRLAWQTSFAVGGLFQLPVFRIGMALVLVAVAANLFGLYTVTVPRGIAQRQKAASAHGGYPSSIAMGLMMAVLATPCSFAILAQAVAWAQLVDLWLGTLAIVLIGVGMAAPHILLVAFPRLLAKLPRSGLWMELFRQSMGFLLLPVAVWLIFAGTEESYPLWVIDFAILLTACLWIYGSWVRYDAPLRRKLVVRGLALTLAVAGGLWMLTPPKPLAVSFVPYDPVGIERAHAAGQTVLLKFTSDTCTSCRTIDFYVFNDPAVAMVLADRNILAMKADTTNRT
ncbi:MAG: protein-disulfide reductase DsbD family protein, partial [Planctomycetota bacterium]|nr:protein-disulfide reductase DsbD family protein [Planctomycetota bacterium]